MLSSERLREILDDLDQVYGSEAYSIMADPDGDIGFYAVNTEEQLAYILGEEWLTL